MVLQSCFWLLYNFVMENKLDMNYKPIVFVGPCSSGKSVLSRNIYGLHDRLNTDALIGYKGDSIQCEDFLDELEFYVYTQQYKAFDIGGSTITCLPPKFQARFQEIFKNATIVEIKPHPDNRVSYHFLKKMIMSESNTATNRKIELVEGVKDDLTNPFIEKLKTVPTIYTLNEIKDGRKLLSPLIPGKKLRHLYLHGLNHIHQKVAEKISNQNDINLDINR